LTPLINNLAPQLVYSRIPYRLQLQRRLSNSMYHDSHCLIGQPMLCLNNACLPKLHMKLQQDFLCRKRDPMRTTAVPHRTARKTPPIILLLLVASMSRRRIVQCDWLNTCRYSQGPRVFLWSRGNVCRTLLLYYRHPFGLRMRYCTYI